MVALTVGAGSALDARYDRLWSVPDREPPGPAVARHLPEVERLAADFERAGERGKAGKTLGLGTLLANQARRYDATITFAARAKAVCRSVGDLQCVGKALNNAANGGNRNGRC